MISASVQKLAFW